MAEPTAFVFNPKEVMTSLLKQQGVHDGMWTLGYNLGIAVSNIGKSQDDPEMRPGMVIQVESVNINRDVPAVSGLTFNAAELNPKVK
jgi:hypothetical protein